MKKCIKCGELIGDNADKCFKCHYDYKKEINELKQEQQRIHEEKIKEAYSKNDIYEYDVVSIIDDNTGAVNIDLLRKTLELHGLEGWRLVNTVSNEIGHNLSRHGVGGFSSGTNATIDQMLLIFERCKRRYTE